MHPTVVVAFIFLCIAATTVLGCAWLSGRAAPATRPLSFLICVTSALLGYGYGIIRFPLDQSEGTTFAEMEKGIALVVSGYLAGKMDAILTPLFKGERDALFVSRTLVAVSSFVIALIATFMARWGYVK